jgi:hypothetical protein
VLDAVVGLANPLVERISPVRGLVQRSRDLNIPWSRSFLLLPAASIRASRCDAMLLGEGERMNSARFQARFQQRGVWLVLLGVVVGAAFGSVLIGAFARADLRQVRDSRASLTANGMPPHFQCYSIKRLKLGEPAQDDRFVKDQFGGKTVDVDEPFSLCAPASKDGDGFDDFSGVHYVCYDIDHGQKPRDIDTGERPDDVFVQNQFTGNFQELVLVKKAETLCVPSFKDNE